MAYNPGVTDPVKDSVMKAIKDLGIPNVHGCSYCQTLSSQRECQPRMNWILFPAVCWSTPIVQHVVNEELTQFPENPQYTFAYIKVPVLDVSQDELEKVRKQYGFSEQEFQAILEYYPERRDAILSMWNWRPWPRPGRNTASIRPLKANIIINGTDHR